MVEYAVPSKAVVREALMKALRAGEIEAGAVSAFNAGRLPEPVLLKLFPRAERIDGRMSLLKAARELDALVERNTRSDKENFERTMR